MDSVVAARNPGDGFGPDARPVEKCRLITSTDPMTAWKQYYLPQTLSEAIQTINSCNPSCLIISGGTDLLLELTQRHRPAVENLIDVSRVIEMSAIEERDGRLFIGAAVPLKHVAANPLVNKHAQALAESTGQIGGPQVRAVGTLGGNVGHALPAGDGAISLLALDAWATITSPQGTRHVPLLDLYTGPGVSSLIPGQEIIVNFDIPVHQAGTGSAFSRVMRPQGVALPVINMAAWITVDKAIIQQASIAVGPAGPIPRRAQGLEKFLTGKTFGSSVLAEGQRILLEEVKFRSSPLRATAEYRDHLAGVLLERVLTSAWHRAVDTSYARVS